MKNHKENLSVNNNFKKNILYKTACIIALLIICMGSLIVFLTSEFPENFFFSPAFFFGISFFNDFSKMFD